jgi:carbon monoxide dehydrogenase subunit G
MQLRGTVNFAAEQTAVWHSLTTPAIVSQCAPRLHRWQTLDTNNQFQLQFAWGSDSNTLLIPLRLTWQTVTPPSLLQWQADAKMGSTPLQFIGEFCLASPNPRATTLTFTVEISPQNKLLQQMIQSTAPRLIDTFFSCLKKTTEAV